MATFEEQLNNLLERTHSIKSPINAAAIGTDINEYNRPSEVWINDVEIFYNNYLKEHPLGDRMKTILFHRNLDAYKNLVGCLESISKDQDFINKMNGISMVSVPKYQAKTLPEFDVFISHANKDKEDLIEELYQSSMLQLLITTAHPKQQSSFLPRCRTRCIMQFTDIRQQS